MSNFKPWIENNLLEPDSNCQTLNSYENDTQRRNGFKGGTGASALRVNSGLRQANLVACALMEAVGDTQNDLTSSVDSVKNSINNYLNTHDIKDNVTTFTQASERSNLSSGEKLSISLGKISKYFSDMKALAYKDIVDTNDIKTNATIDNAKNVSDKINGKNISDIFEENGTTVKLASVANNIVYTTVAPTEAPPEGTMTIYYGTSTPTTRYDRVLYLISY